LVGFTFAFGGLFKFVIFFIDGVLFGEFRDPQF